MRLPSLVASIAATVVVATAPAPSALSDGTSAHRADVPAPAFVFPLAAPARIGTGAEQRFGGARGHLGQDVFASCGSPVLAARAGTVERNAFQGGAGNYLVVDSPDGTSNVYMHLARPARPAEGDVVTAGERVGAVGDTGDAFGCHLHFEQWTAPGWYAGGHAVDPYRELVRAAPPGTRLAACCITADGWGA